MHSQALKVRLEAVLGDAAELVEAHRKLRTGATGRQWRLGAINRAVVVMCAAAWESYVEEVIKEAVEVLRPIGPDGGWPAWKASVLGQVGRFHNPNSQQVRELFANSLGLMDVTANWFWQHCSSAAAIATLDDYLNIRHAVAHGNTPRPVVHNSTSSSMPGFMRRLARQTDVAVHEHLISTFGIANPW